MSTKVFVTNQDGSIAKANKPKVIVKACVDKDAECNICHESLFQFATFYDGATSMGPWAWMCLKCWQYNGRGIGTGVGQEYNSKTLEKIRG